MNNKSSTFYQKIRLVILLAIVFVLSTAIALILTFSALQDSKKATGTITFDLADYNVNFVNLATGFNEQKNIAPGISVALQEIKLLNTSTEGTGTEAGLGGVYIKLSPEKIIIGDTTYNITSVTNDGGEIKLNAGVSELYAICPLDITLKTNTGLTGITWGVKSGAIYLMKGNAEAQLPFTSKNAADTDKSYAHIYTEVKGKTAATKVAYGGFNPTDAIGVLFKNEDQGKTVTIEYKAYWGITLDDLNIAASNTTTP